MLILYVDGLFIVAMFCSSWKQIKFVMRMDFDMVCDMNGAYNRYMDIVQNVQYNIQLMI